MKTNLLLFILVFTIFSAQAQVVFCPAGSVWKSIHTRSWPDQTLETETVTYSGKQFISPDTVKVLTHKRFFMDVNMVLGYTTYIKQIGDTVFMKNSATLNKWQILYNYAAQAGDSWYDSLKVGSGTGIRAYTISVVSTQTVNVQGFVLKQLTVHQHHNWSSQRNDFTYSITERVGSNIFVFPFGGMAASDGDYFIENLCYADNTFGTYHYSNKSCDYTILLGVEESAANSEINLFPNPSSGSIHLKTQNGSKVYHYSINSSFGQKIKEGDTILSAENLEIEIQDLSPGIYFLSLKTTEGTKEIVKRFVKTN